MWIFSQIFQSHDPHGHKISQHGFREDFPAQHYSAYRKF